MVEATNPNPLPENTKPPLEMETCKECGVKVEQSYFPKNAFMPEPLILSSLRNGKCDECVKKSMVEPIIDLPANKRDRTNPADLGGPKPFHEFTLEKFNRAAQPHLFDVASAFNPKMENLYLYGPCGTGKSHIATAIAHRESQKGLRVKVVLLVDLMRSFRGLEAREEEEAIEKLVVLPVFVIDDLGVGKGTEFVMQIIFEILTKRDNAYQNGLIITSNLDLNELAEKMGTDRLSSRIKGMCKVIKVEGRDWRV